MTSSGEPMDADAQAELNLVLAATRGDRRAQEQLWQSHRRWVAAIIIAHRPRTIDVDDLMQDVAIKLISKLGMLRDPEAFRPWLRRIAINICRGAARSQKPTLRLSDPRRDDDDRDSGFHLPASNEPTSDDGAITRDAADHVLKQVLGLPPEYREPLLLRCQRSLTYQQIGELLDLPVTTVETRLARGRRMLREEIGQHVYFADED